MASELVFNGILLLFTIYCFVIIGDLPDGTSTDTLTASMYPRIIIGLLIVLFISNMINIYKNKKEGETFKVDFSIEKIVKNKIYFCFRLYWIYNKFTCILWCIFLFTWGKKSKDIDSLLLRQCNSYLYSFWQFVRNNAS